MPTTQPHVPHKIAYIFDAPPPRLGPRTGSVLGWLPYLWQRVLFPGPQAMIEKVRWGALLSLFVISSVVIYPFLNFYLFEPDEGRYAQIPLEMLERGDVLVPTLFGEPYLDKPPLFYWLVMAAYRLFGSTDWVARLVPALATQLCVLLVYLLGRRHVGERSAFWASLLLSLAPGLASMGRILVLDSLLTTWVTLALLAGLEAIQTKSLARGWWAILGFALGLGTLTKGPIAVILVLPPLLAHRWLTNHPTRISAKAWFALASIIAAINLPWYLAITWQQPEFASYFLWKHNLQRFLNPFDHERPIWFFLPVLLAGLAPMLWLLPKFVRFLLVDKPEISSQRSSAQGYFLLAGAWCVFFFSLSGSKLPTYILPAFPPLCLVIGAYVVSSGWNESRWFRRGLCVWGLMLVVGHAVVLPRIAWERSPMNHAAEGASYLADTATPIFSYPRHLDSVAFYLGRSDLQVYRSKELPEMLQAIDKHPRSVLLFAHRNSKLILTHNLPPHFRVVYVGKLGLCDMAVIER